MATIPASTDRAFGDSASTESATAAPDGVEAVWRILDYELVPQAEWAEEADVLGLPEVQEGLSDAVLKFEEWKKTL